MGQAQRHVRREVGLVLPLEQRLALEELDLQVTPRGDRARRVGIVVVGEVLDGLPLHAAGLFEITRRHRPSLKEQPRELGIGVAPGEEVEIGLRRFWIVRRFMVARDKDLATRVCADAAELRSLLGDEDRQAFVVRGERGGDRGEAGARADPVEGGVEAQN